MTRRPTRRRGRKRPSKKPLDKFLDNVARMLETVATTAVFSGGAVLLGRMLGTPPPPVELPPGLSPGVRAEWEMLLGVPRGRSGRKSGKAETIVEDLPNRSRPEPVKLLKGPDGIYRPDHD